MKERAILLGQVQPEWRNKGIGKFLMKGEPAERHPYLWGARAMFLGLILVTVLMVWLAWRKKKQDLAKG